MEERAQALGKQLSEAITEGRAEEAIDLIKTLAELDADIKLTIQPKGDPLLNSRMAQVPQNPPGLTQQQQLIFDQLQAMGVEAGQARTLAEQHNSVEEAVNAAFA